jgi:hypothetical protein
LVRDGTPFNKRALHQHRLATVREPRQALPFLTFLRFLPLKGNARQG